MAEQLKHKSAETVAQVVYVGTRLLGGDRQEATQQGRNAGLFVDAILNDEDRAREQEEEDENADPSL